MGRDEIATALGADIELGVGDAGYLENVAAVASARGGAPARIHLKIDTGLHRNGIRPEDWAEVVSRAAALEASGGIRVVGVWSHIAETSDESDDQARAEFVTAVDTARQAGLITDVLHLAASAAGYARAEFRHDLVRFGAFSYGIRSTGAPTFRHRPRRDAPRAGDARGRRHRRGRLRVARRPALDARRPRGRRDARRSPSAARRGRDIPHRWRVARGRCRRCGGGLRAGTFGESSVTTLAEAIGTVGEEIIVRVSPLVPRRYV